LRHDAACAALAAALAAAAVPAMVAAPQVVHADLTTVSGNNLRQGWVSNETALTPASVANGGLHQRFDIALPGAGQAYAEPLVIGSRVIVATETDTVYAVDRYTGAVDWMDTLGTPEPSVQVNCTDVTPNLGTTSTPVYDPSTSTIYVTAKTWDGARAATATWNMHALSLTSGKEVSGWPVALDKTLSASNQPLLHFDPTHQQQRTGLLLMGGRVFVGFGSQCDNPNYQGWIASISTTVGSVKMWTAEQSATDASGNSNGGIWMAGGGLMSDGPGRIFFSTGNGACKTYPPATDDNCFGPPPGPADAVHNTDLAESVVRVNVNTNGSLTAADYFAPYNAAVLSSQDSDLASSGVTALPDNFGNVPAHPHLLLLGSKNSRDYLLDRDSLGGEVRNGTTNTDAGVVAETIPGAAPVYGHAGIWPGDGGYIYFSGYPFNPCPGYTCGLDAYQVQVSGATVSLVRVAEASRAVGFGTGSPVVTSNGTASGTALVWQVEMPLAGLGETVPELRTYLPVPTNSKLTMVSHIPLGHPVDKFIVPTIDNGQVFIGTADGHLLAYETCSGRPLAGDFTGGGTADLVSIGQHGTCVLASTGTAFTAPTQWSRVPLSGQRATLSADVSGDGRSDLVAVNNASTSVMTSAGSSFTSPQHWSGTAFYGQQATLAADVNHDGRADLIAVNNASTWVMLSTGSGFSAPHLWSSTPFYGTRATLAADITGDGRVDLVAVDDASTWVLLSTGSGFSAPKRWSNVPFYGNRATLVGDVTGGGRADLVAVNDASVWVMTSNGAGFSAPRQWHGGTFFGSVATLGGDVSGDKRMDLVAVNLAGTFVMTSTGAAFGTPTLWWGGYP
jgi:FG-GAP-like repeat